MPGFCTHNHSQSLAALLICDCKTKACEAALMLKRYGGSPESCLLGMNPTQLHVPQKHDGLLQFWQGTEDEKMDRWVIAADEAAAEQIARDRYPGRDFSIEQVVFYTSSYTRLISHELT